jgi:hypothetical protein
MSPQVARNNASRRLFGELAARYPELDREWLRQAINAITIDELRLIRRDIVADLRRLAHYHGGAKVLPEEQLISARRILENIDRRISGEHA